MKKRLIHIFTALILMLSLFACNKDSLVKKSGFSLTFSKDSVLFDTVFSGIGSTTRYFKVKNPSNQAVQISEIYLEKGMMSKFRLNINGVPENKVKDIVIEAHDSLFIFADVTINTNNDDLLVSDRVLFNTGDKKQQVVLTAFGQDVHFIKDSVITTQTWTKDKPYLIYNSVALAENEHLSIEPGTHIYSHKGSEIMILGTLSVNGTYEEPVIFEADRRNAHSSVFNDIFDNDSTDNYYDVAGQWSGIWLTKLSKNNVINYALIKNAETGIRVDSVSGANPQLLISNSVIEHHSYAGIYAQLSSIQATNCLINDCGYYNIALIRGGAYEFYHCTIDNHWKGVRRKPAVYINNYFIYDNSIYLYNLDKAHFGNCIIWGNKETETEVDLVVDGGIEGNYLFENSILKIDPKSNINTNDQTHYKNILLNTAPLYIDEYEYNFMLSEDSPAINAGSRSIPDIYPDLLQNDLNNISRINDSAPDIGCYEYQ